MTKCGELNLIRLLGRGGMSEVWEAVNPRLESRHAVKIYAYDRADAEVRARFEQEGRMLARLRHPRIVSVGDVGVSDDGRPYFVMDLILSPDGSPKTLADIQDGSVDEDTIARWYDDLREGLAYIHARGIVHRDLKLQNVMVGPDGHAVLTDFGISRVTEAPEGGKAIASPVKTVLHLHDGRRPVMGSLGYMAPELEMGCPATPQSDWFALGVIVYRLLTGTWCDARTDLTGMLASFHPVWLGILPKLLHANPRGRACPSFAETAAALRDADACAAETQRDRATLRLRRARRRAALSAGFCALLALALGGVSLHYVSERNAWHRQGQLAAFRRDAPTFEELFAIPPEAKADETVDEDGNVAMPSRSQFDASRVDALVLTHGTLSALASGRITAEKAIAEFEKLAETFDGNTGLSPLDGLEFGGNGYLQIGDNDSLRLLLEKATEKLRAWSEG